jgi:Mn2+/Fe2+ NRAMP family transporter
MNIVQRIKVIGPGAMVAAAFIGPGTVTTASVTLFSSASLALQGGVER